MKKITFALFVLIFTACSNDVLVNAPPEPDCFAVEEKCNDKDDDCDGIIDNPEVLGVKPCYTYDPKTLLYGECRFGIQRCTAGVWSCQGEVSPAEEVCNGKDDDCNGKVDELETSGVDIVFAIDYSGSMDEEIKSLVGIINGWGAKYANKPGMKVALVGIPTDVASGEGQAQLMLPLSSITDFIVEVNKHTLASGGGMEASLDAIYLVSDIRNYLNINWTPNASKAIFLITDESPQSYLKPRISESIANSTALANNVKVFIFTNATTWWAWKPYPLSTTSLLEVNIDAAISRSACKE